MAHWNEKRDARWVRMMQDCNYPEMAEAIRKFEETGDIIYFTQFIDHLRSCSLRKKSAATSPASPKA